MILSDEVQALKFSERPQVNITRNGGLLDISFDFSQVFEEDIDDALKALFNNDSYFISDQGKLVIFDEETQKLVSLYKN